MADEADLATIFVEQEVARGIAAARQPMAIGAPGECDDCGRDSPRIVDGRCAPCRDRRAKRYAW